jgi:lipopolysaccharide transport system permease protein
MQDTRLKKATQWSRGGNGLQSDRKVIASQPVIVVTPESQLRRPYVLLRQMGQDLLNSRELAWQLLYKAISIRYRQAALGPLWAFLPPIVVALTSTLIRNSGVIAVRDTPVPYPLYVMFATALWLLFARSFEMPLKAMQSGMQLLRTIRMPIEGVLLAAAGELLFDQAIQFLVLAGVFLAFKVQLSWYALLAPLAALSLMVLGTGLGLFLVPIGTLYTDVGSTVPFLTRFWFFFTPVLYPPPTQWPYSMLVELNPVTPLLTGVLDLAIQGRMSNPIGFVMVSALAFVLLFVGWVIYRVAIPILVER